MTEEKKGRTGMSFKDSMSIFRLSGDRFKNEVYAVQFLLEERNTMHEMPGKT
jgi:hypothetical protein